VIERAQGEAAHVFQPMDVKIHWIECTAVTSKDPAARPDFILRLLPGGQIAKSSVVSPEAMGRALIDQSDDGYMLDAYYGAIQQLSLLYPLASEGQVLGYTIAHELGHLLIGPGHRSDGIMRASWGRNEVAAISHRFFYFKAEDSAVIQRRLRTRLSATAVNP
jgi:hypothetical protein